ncbi:MAG TPA: ribosome-associated translation inhibitor RaiA [Caldilineaceae bacterium]|nr:ribosome-associated translation inhibitor RaiA [Caldilineaceae bacterium]
MQLIVHGRNVEITDWIREYVQKKVGKLDRYLNQVSEARVELAHNAARAADDRYTVQITFWANGQILRAEESTSDIFASIDAAADKMARQVRRFKGRRYQTKRRAAAAANAEAELAATLIEEVPEEEEEEMGRIIRRKEFVLEPMNEEEALAQMELLGHDFFVYYDVDARAINVIYRRRDGQYGLLQPRIG